MAKTRKATGKAASRAGNTLDDYSGRSFPFSEARVERARQLVAEGDIDVDASGRRSWMDADTTGLSLVVGKGGSGTFYFVGKVAGRAVRRSLGDVDVVRLNVAREVVGRLRYDRTVAAAIMPRPAEPTDDIPADNGPTVGDAVLEMLDAHEAGRWLPGSRSRVPTDRTMKFYRDLRRATLADHEGLTLKAFAEQLPDVFAALRKRAPYQANRFLQLVRNLYGHAIDRGSWQAPNPAMGTSKADRLTRATEAHRTRFLTDTEYGKLTKALESDDPVWRDLFRASVLTAQRMSAVANMRWDDIDLGHDPSWRIPAKYMKGRKAGHTVTLNADAVAMLKARRKVVPKGVDYVFPAPTGDVIRADSWKTAWKRIITRANLWHEDKDRRPRPHDLRRTAGARMTAQGIATPIVTKALGNSASSAGMVAKVYAQVADEALRDAFNATTSMGGKRRR
jgi:integrase